MVRPAADHDISSGGECLAFRTSRAHRLRALEKVGLVVARQRGSHVVLRRGTIGCVAPIHRELKIGTIAGILKQAGVSAEQIVEALR